MSELEVEERRPALDDEGSQELDARAMYGVTVGVLIGFKDDGRTPLVIVPQSGGASAIAARSTIDVHGAHIGRQVVLLFEGADARRPIIVGCIRRNDGSSVCSPAGQVEVDADGERLIVSARDRLVLRCGRSSITLTRSGKILIEGAYVSSESTGVLRIKGGSVQLN